MPSLSNSTNRKQKPLLLFSVLFLLTAGVAISQETPQAESPPTDKPIAIIEDLVVPEQDALINIVVNGEEFWNIEAKYNGTTPFVKQSILAEYMKKYLMPTEYDRLFNNLYANLEYLGASNLNAGGILTQWDESNLTYDILIPTEMSTRIEIDFAEKPSVPDLSAYPRAKIASAINLSTNIDANFSSSSSNFSFSADLDGLLKVWEIAFEGAAAVTVSNLGPVFSASKANLVLDLPTIGSRLLAGKVNSEGMSYQTRSDLWGISIGTVDVFSRYDRISSPAVAFELERSSTIKILINDFPVRMMKLARGRYRVYDLPFSAGLNTITIQVEDSSGENKWFQPILPYIAAESGILIGGQYEFGASAGVGYTEPTEPFASAYFRYGLDYKMTFSAYSQADVRSILFGGALITGTPIGIFSAETAAILAWDGRANPFSLGTNFRYRINFPARPRFPNLNFMVEYYSPGFSPPQPTSSTTASSEAKLNVTGFISGNIINNLWYNSSIGWERTENSPVVNILRATVGMSYVPNKNTSFVINSGLTLQSTSSPKIDLSILATITPPRNSNSRISLEQGGEGTSSLEYAQTLPLLGGMDFSVRATNLIGGVSQRTSFSSLLRKPGSIGEASLRGAIAYGGNTTAYDASLNLSGRTALAFADGIFALSRSLTDSFVIVVPENEAKKEKINFSTSSSGSVTTKGVPRALSLSSYRPNNARTDFPEADADIIATIPEIILYPRYRSGIVFKVDIKKETSVSGRLVDSSQKAYSYIVGDIFKTEDDTHIGSAFTYEDGTFLVYSLSPGKYRIEWPTGIGNSVFEIPTDATENFDLGDITAEGAKE